MTGRSLLDEAASTPAPRDPWTTLAEVEAGLRAVLTLKPPPTARRQLEAILDTVTDARKHP